MPTSHSDDIPEALRDSTPSKSSIFSQSSFPLVWIGMVGLGAIAMGAVTALLWQPVLTYFSVANATSDASEVRDATPPDGSEDGSENPGNINGTATVTAEQGDGTASDTDDATNELLGHRFYEEAPEETLVPVVGDGSIRLREPAAKSFTEMVNAARSQGIQLQPLSGFRTEDEQEYLFFEIKKSRRQSSQERATVSAPPGYSEHHTGYAIDIGDPNQPITHLEESFAETPAFQWLEENAAAYGFELSFEGGSNDTVSYEPWHWRYVGDRHSLEIFYGNTNVTSPEAASSEADGADALSPESSADSVDEADAEAEVNPQ